MDVGSLVTRLMMDASQFDSTINKSQKEIAAFKAKAESVGNGVNKVFSGVAGTALKLVPAIAAGATALGAFNKILKTSGSLADSFDKVSLQIGAAIDYIAERAADLNFNNAIDGLKESIKLAGDLADILDNIGTLNTYKNLDVNTLRRLEAEQKKARINYELNPNKESKAALNAATTALKRQQVKVTDSYDSVIKEEKNKLENYKKTVAKKAGFQDDPLAIWAVGNLASNSRNLAMSQERYKKFNSKTFKIKGINAAPSQLRYNSYGPSKISGLNILKNYDWARLIKSDLLPVFKPFFEKATGQKLTEQNYEKQRRFIPISNLEGLKEGEEDDTIDVTAVTDQMATIAGLEADKISSEYQSLMNEKKARDKADRNNTKVNTKLTNTNETLEEINKKFEDAKALLSLQNKEGYLDKESYLKELLKTTDSYIDKLYDPLYANLEGVKELRSAAISAKDGILKQLKDLNKPQGETKLGNTYFNLINSDLYRQLEKLIYSQLGPYYGTEDKALKADWSRNTLGKSLINTRDSDFDRIGELLEMIEGINESISLNYGKVITTILENDINILGEKASSVFERAFGGISEALTSSEVYDFLNAVRIMTSLPEEMAKKFREEWIRMNNNPNEIVSNSGINKPFIPSIEAFKELQKSDPSALNFVDPTYRPIESIQSTRESSAIILNQKNLKKKHKELYEKLKDYSFDVDKKDYSDFFRQSAPVQTVEDLETRLKAFKDYNRLNDLDFFNNLDSQLIDIDKSLQNRIKALNQRLLNLIGLKKKLEDQFNTGKVKEKGADGKEVERDLTEDEIAKVKEKLDTINDVTGVYGKYIRQLESSQLATQKLIQISQVFGIKQKEIKEKFDGFRDVSSSIGEVTSAFEALDNKVGDFAKTLGALNNFANIIANLVEKLNLLKEANKAAKIAADATAAATNNETTATTTNTAATAANTAATTTDTAVSTAKTAANVGEAASEGTKQASKLPFPANIAAIAAVLAAIGGAAATISSLSRKKYATGGIVTGPGSSFSDSIPISVSNGEMILNKSQQKNLFDLLNYGGGSSRGGGSSEVNFKILGENLVGSINNRNKGRNKIL